MVFVRWVFGLFLFGLLLAGCVQQPSPAASPTPVASVAALPTLAVPTASPTASATASAASATPRIPYIPSAKPSELPSATPTTVPTLAAGVPTLADFAVEFNVATNRAFNDSRKVYESSRDIWVVDQTTNEYQYTIFIRPAKTRAFGAFDTVATVYGASGTPKQVSLDAGETGPYYKYALVMKCYNARYDVEMTLLDYVTQSGTTQYRRTLGSSVMLTLADACPN